MKILFVTICSLFAIGYASAAVLPNNPPVYNDIDNSCRDRGVVVTYGSNGRDIGVSHDRSKTDFNMSVERKDGSRLNYDSRTQNTTGWANTTNRVNSSHNEDGAVDASRIDIKCYDRQQK